MNQDFSQEYLFSWKTAHKSCKLIYYNKSMVNILELTSIFREKRKKKHSLYCLERDEKTEERWLYSYSQQTQEMKGHFKNQVSRMSWSLPQGLAVSVFRASA